MYGLEIRLHLIQTESKSVLSPTGLPPITRSIIIMAKESKKSTVVDRTIYPFRTMKIGEEFFIPNATDAFKSYVYHRARTLERRFTIRTETRKGVTGVVVERVPL